MGPIALLFGGKAILCQIIIVILWVPTCVPADRNKQGDGEIEPEDGSSDYNNTCKAPECRKMLHTIRRQMGNKTPCEDFHEYVCGNWKGDRELNSSVLKEKAVITLAGLLRKTVESLEFSNTTRKLIRAYQSCLKKGKDKRALGISIRDVLLGYNVTNSTWPIVHHLDKQPVQKESGDYVDVLKKTGPRPVFSISVTMEGGAPIILLNKPSEFFVFDDEDYNPTITSDENETPDPASESLYQNYEDLLAQDEKAYRTFIRKTIRLLNEYFSREEVKNATEDIVSMEKGFSRLATAAKQKNPLNMTLSELDKRLGNKISMAEILQRDFEGLNITINESTVVLVQYIDYFEEAVNLMKCTRRETLINYIFWTFIRKMAEAVGTQLNKIYENYRNSTPLLHFTPTEESESEEAESVRLPSNLSLQCVHQLLHTDVMYTGVANFYIKAKFNKTFKEDVLKMMAYVNYSFMDVVQNNTWMSTTTKEEVFMRLHSMRAMIGYPDWMLNDTIIDDLYWLVPYVLKEASFVEHYHYLTESSFKQELLRLQPERYINRSDEDIPLRSHAYYAPRTNTMVYPAASLVTHYRSPPIPRSANYGTIGTILAQLLTKLLDRYEYRSKETGKYNKNTWDNETRDNFCNRSSCLNNTEECNDTTVYQSHKLQTMQDYLGVRISYTAMTNSTGNYTPPLVFPGKKLNSERKIFFIFFGSLYCPYSVNEKRIQSRADDGEKFPDTLNEIVYTYTEFNTTFNCTPTKDADTCYLTPGRSPPKPAGC